MNTWNSNHLSFSLRKPHSDPCPGELSEKKKITLKSHEKPSGFLRSRMGFKLNIARLECKNLSWVWPFFSFCVTPHLYLVRQMCLVASREGHVTAFTEHLVNGSSVQRACQLWNSLCALIPSATLLTIAPLPIPQWTWRTDGHYLLRVGPCRSLRVWGKARQRLPSIRHHSS